ncbi:MAG: serine hydrolase [Bacteroidales bacterium]|nr:serine hydrolase [Bacteroidales bacterium]
MKCSSLFIIVASLFLLQRCNTTNDDPGFYGFWEGPHPEDVNKKFYIQIIGKNDSVRALGFWTNHKFYDSQFKIDSIFLNSDSIRFYVPDWNCLYLGSISDNHLINGGFSCMDEPFDPVDLIKNDEARRFLTEAKPDCNHVNYSYHYQQPDFFDESIPAMHFQTPNDSLFIHSLLPEIIANQYGRLNSFLLLKNGRLICEEYFYGYSRNDLHQIESATKSIASLLIGIATDKGMISDINEPLFNIFPGYDHLSKGEYRKITLANILSMTSCFSNEYEPFMDADRIDYSLKRALIAPVGEQFIYDGGNTEILGAVIKSKTGMYADVFAKQFLFTPLGIKQYDWNIFKQDSFPCMGGSLQMLPVDMLKIGFLVLNKGVCNNQQIISADWITESTSKKTRTHIEGDDYAYHWWNIVIESNRKKYETVWANGLGSQFIYIVPELNIVIVTTGYNYENDSWAITSGIGKYLYLLE